MEQSQIPCSVTVWQTAWVRCSCIALLGVAACTQVIDTGVLAGGGTTATVSTDDSSTTSVTTSVASTGPQSQTTSTTSAPSTDGGDATTSGSTTTGDESTGETEGGGGPVGSPCGAEQKVCGLVTLDDEPAGSCGGTLDIKGIVSVVEPGIFELQDCGACELCGGPTYTIEFFAPDMWAPDPMPLCSHVSVDFAPMNADTHACAFVGMAIWEDDGLGEDPAPLWIGASIEVDPPTGLDGLSVALENVAPDACDELDCCEMEPGDYEITFTGAGIDPALTLAEKDIAEDVTVFSRPYDFHNVRSHAHKECDKIPHLDWIMRRD